MLCKNPAPKNVKIEEFPITFGSHGLKLHGKAYLPEGTHTESPLPGAVLCHGFGSSHRVMKSSARIMAKQGIATFVFDFRGHGASEGAVDDRMAEDVVDAWDTLRRFPGVDTNRMGLIGHSLGAMSAILGADKVASPKMLVALACPPKIDEEMFANATKEFGQWGHKYNHIIEFPRHGTFPWLTGIAAIAARLWMYLSRYYVRINLKKFVRGIVHLDMVEVVSKLDRCAKLFVFCEGDTITPYLKSVLVYDAACEPKVKFLAKGQHSTPISRGSLRSQWITWAVNTLYDRENAL